MSKENRQLEDGFLKLSNGLLEDILLSDLSKEELKITFAIVRQTYGWKGRKMAPISVSLFQVLTGIDRRHVQRSLKSLIDRGMVGRSTGAKMKYGKPVYNYWIIKKGYSQYGYSTIANTATEAIANTALIKERNKTLKKERKSLVDKFKM